MVPKVWITGGHNSSGEWTGIRYGSGHLSGIHGLALTTCARIGTTEQLEDMTMGAAACIREDGCFIRDPYGKTTPPQVSQDMCSSWFMGAIEAANRLHEDSPARIELVRKTKLFADLYISDGYAMRDGIEYGYFISPRFRNTPGLNYNYYPDRPVGEHFSMVTGVAATIALSILYGAYTITGRWKYRFHYWLLKYVFGYGLWAFMPNIYLWKGAVPSWFPKLDNSAPPNRAAYFNDGIAFEATLARVIAHDNSSWLDRLWLRNIRNLHKNYYWDGRMEAVIAKMDHQAVDPVTLMQLTSLSNTQESGENFWTNSIANGVWPLANDLPIQEGNNSFCLYASFL